MPELEIYVHIPFCVQKCAYCDFLSAPAGRKERDRYVNTLIEEIRSGRPVSAPVTGSFDSPFYNQTDIGNGQRTGSPRPERPPDGNKYLISSVFFGGGTPSILKSSQIAEILEALRSTFLFAGRYDSCGIPEITIESNPGAVGDAGASEVKEFRRYLASGVNRISFGLQSADNGDLAVLGRIHTWETFLHSYQAAREAGFTNINIDLMSALPGQTLKSWERILRQVLELAPEHISAYSLIIEEGTPFYEKYHEDDLRRSAGEEPRYLPSEEEERRMAQITEQMLCGAGYVHYEISNYARPGFECRHNIGYWRGTEYMGFGLGASSLLRYPLQSHTRMMKKVSVDEGSISVRCKNPENFAGYERKVHSQNMSVEAHTVDLGETEISNSPHTDSSRSENPKVHIVDAGKSENPEMRTADTAKSENPEVLTVEDEMAEFMFLGLRMLSGVSAQEFQTRFGRSIDNVYGDVIRRMRSLGLMMRRDDRIYLTPRGLDVSNQVMAEFLL